MPATCFYVDNSNIFIEGQRYAEERAREDRYGFRIYFRNFAKLALRDRTADETVWAGSIPPPEDSVWGHLRDLGIDPELIERADAGEQETVDHLIQLRMHRHVRKYREDPGVIILATGDGKGYDQEDGFLYDLEGFVEDGWSIELLSWEHSCHRRLRAFAEENGEFIPLDQYYEQITFIVDGRLVKPI